MGKGLDHVFHHIGLILPASADDHVRGLGASRGDEPVERCLFFASVVTASVREARRLASMVEQLRADWLTRAGTHRRDSSAGRLIEQITAQPIVSVARAMEITDTSRPASDRAIVTLERAGILRPLGNRRRNRQWEAPEVFDLLERFERELAYV